MIYKSSDLDRDVNCIQDHEECVRTEKNFWGNEVCVQWNTVCDVYREMISMTLTNLDTERGTWYYNVVSRCKSNQPLCTLKDGEERMPYSRTLDSTETETLGFSTHYLANGQQYSFISFTRIPTKQVCRDVIKTRQDCHTETKYRTVTKYRIVTKCD